MTHNELRDLYAVAPSAFPALKVSKHSLLILCNFVSLCV